MVVVYSAGNTKSGKKIKKELEDNDIEVVYKCFYKNDIKRSEVDYLLRKKGREILGVNKKEYRENKELIESLNHDELVQFIVYNKYVLRLPITVSKERIMIGYDKEDLEDYIERYKKEK